MLHTVAAMSGGHGRERDEFFLTQLSLEGAPLPGSSPCLSRPGVTVASHVQSRVRMSPQYNQLDVRRESVDTTVLFGSCLGTFAAFLAWGGGLVALADFVERVRERGVSAACGELPCVSG